MRTEKKMVADCGAYYHVKNAGSLWTTTDEQDGSHMDLTGPDLWAKRALSHYHVYCVLRRPGLRLG